MNVFKLNSKVELITESEEKTTGLIQDIVDDKIYVSIPSDDKKFKILRVGDKINGVIYDEKTVLSFDAIMTKRVFGDIPTYELSSICNISKVQRRQDVRVACSLEILYTTNTYLLNVNIDKVEAPEMMNNISKYGNHGIISDLSAGGIKFSCDENLMIGDMLLLLFKLETDTIITQGLIVYKELTISPKKIIYIYGIEFKQISETKREKIINYIFISMRKNRLK